MSFNQVSVRRSNVRMYVGMVGKTTLLALARYFEKSLMKILRNLVRYLALPFALFLSILMRNITKFLARFREILCHLILDGTECLHILFISTKRTQLHNINFMTCSKAEI